MKFERNDKYNTIALYSFLVIAASIGFYYLLHQLSFVLGRLAEIAGFVAPVVYGFIFAYLLNPIARFFQEKILSRLFKKMKPSVCHGIAILITYVVTLLFIALFFALVLPQIISSLLAIGANVPSYLKSVQTLYYLMTDSVANLRLLEDSRSAQIIQIAIDYSMQFFEDTLEKLGSWLTTDLFGIVVAGATKFTGGVLNIFIGAIVSVYILIEKDKLLSQSRKIGTAVFKENAFSLLRDIASDCHRIVGGFVLGKLIDSLIVGILCFIIMSIIGLPYAMLISVIVGVANIIPYFGPIIGAIPGFLLIFISDLEKGPAQSLLFIVFLLVLMQLDGNVIEPKILGDTIGLSAIWIIFSIMLFSGLLGVLGMFIGVPLFAIIYSIFNRIITYILRKKGKPLSTDEYALSPPLPAAEQKEEDHI